MRTADALRELSDTPTGMVSIDNVAKQVAVLGRGGEVAVKMTGG